MSDDTKKVYVSGTSFSNLLFLVFLVLKLTKVIDWSWWWVTSPIWIPVSILLVTVFVTSVILSFISTDKKQ